ncbi:MAG: Mu transposase C-terminal domain-containing protein [Chromatiaceae bacterium]
MTEDDDRRDDEPAMILALFRYGVIAPLVEQEQWAPGELSRLVREIGASAHHLPGKGPLTVSERTVYSWLRLYRTGGIEALRPRWRKDRGRSRAVDDSTLARAVQLRKDNNERQTKTLLDILQREGSLAGKPVPHRATLDRHLRLRGASRRQLHVLGNKRTIKMQFENFGDLWVGDYHHGPVILGPNGQVTTAKLGAFIDHTTRYPVADRYYLAEDIASLRDCLLRALLRWGRFKKAYVDRGAVYRAEQRAYSLRRIEATLIHSRAYYSQGRGVIERWWHVANSFESEVALREEPLSLHELNRLWEAYRELRYSQEIHSAIGRTPNEAVGEVTPQLVDPEVVRELFLVRVDRTVHKKDGCVAVEGRRFLVESFLRGQRVQVRFDPGDLSSVLIFQQGRRIQKAFPQPLNAQPEPHPNPEQVWQSVDYLALLREDYDRKLLEHARPLAYTQLEAEPQFGVDQFLEVVTALAGIKLNRSGRQELCSFWNTFGPLPEALVRIATEHAIRLHGRTRHPRVYLHAIRTLVLAHWRGSGKESS